MSEQLKNLIGESERIRRNQSKADFSELIETCFDEGWFPTKCHKGCARPSLTESARTITKVSPSNSA